MSAINKTDGIDNQKALEIYLSILKNAPSVKEKKLTSRESLALFVAKNVVIEWKGIKYKNPDKQIEKHYIFYRILVTEPNVLNEILKSGVKEFNRRNSAKIC